MPLTLLYALRLAQHHLQQRQYPQAEAACREILAQVPEQPDALNILGIVAATCGKADAGVDLIRRAVAENPNQPEFRQNLGKLLRQLGRHGEAIEVFAGLVERSPVDVEAQMNLGDALFLAAQDGRAIEAYRRVIDLKPDHAEAHNNLGFALQRVGRTDEAIAQFRRAIALRPAFPEAFTNLGNALQEKTDPVAALAALRQAIALRPDFMLPYNSLGGVLRHQGELEPAIAAYDRAIALDPRFPAARNNRAQTLVEAGRMKEALEGFQSALTLDPADPEAHWNLACALLLGGDYVNGWREFEWRRPCGKYTGWVGPFTQPRWDGGDIAGKTLLVYAEQGLGDVIQCVRYAPLIAALGAKVVLEVQPPLARLMRSVAGIAEVCEERGPRPSFDIQAPIMSLPGIFRTTPDNIPGHAPYVYADPAAREAWRQRLAEESRGFDGLRVGLAWAGNPQHPADRWRSIPLSALDPILAIPDVRFYSLQKDPPTSASASSTESGGRAELVDYTADLRDLADTAALVANLDLIITVDTSAAHLAGAMGKPAWVLLRSVPDWRWMLGRDDSPWYPTLKLFRQTHRANWSSVITRVAAELADVSRKA